MKTDSCPFLGTSHSQLLSGSHQCHEFLRDAGVQSIPPHWGRMAQNQYLTYFSFFWLCLWWYSDGTPKIRAQESLWGIFRIPGSDRNGTRVNNWQGVPLISLLTL